MQLAVAFVVDSVAAAAVSAEDAATVEPIVAAAFYCVNVAEALASRRAPWPAESGESAEVAAATCIARVAIPLFVSSAP